MSHSPIRLALIGCGDNAALWRDIAMRLRYACITVVIDSDAALGKSTAEAIGASIVVDSLGTALKKHCDEFDAIIINTSLVNKSEITQLASDAQKHIMVNAPVANALVEVEAIIETCKQNDICFAVRETLRFTPSIQVIKDCLNSGKLGDPSLLRVHRWRSINHDVRPPLAEALFADIDLALWLFDAKPTEVYTIARGDNNDDGTMPDYIQIHFGFASGAMALLDFSTSLPNGKGYDSLSLIGSTGAAYADDHNNTHLLFNGGNPAALISGQGNGHLALELQDFIDAIIGQTKPQAGSKDCLRVHQVIDAICQSLKTKQVQCAQGDVYV